jgi:hypothetical protein
MEQVIEVYCVKSDIDEKESEKQVIIAKYSWLMEPYY